MSSSTSTDISSDCSLLQQWQSNPEEAFILGVELAFERWATLHLVTENVNKIDELFDWVIEIFLSDENNKQKTENIEPFFWDEISDYLYDALLENFNVDAQDGSCEQTAKLLCQLYSDCFINNDFTGLLKMHKSSATIRNQIAEAKSQIQIENSSDNDEEESNESEGMSDSEAPQLIDDEPQRNERQIDEDGFETVTRKGRRR